MHGDAGYVIKELIFMFMHEVRSITDIVYDALILSKIRTWVCLKYSGKLKTDTYKCQFKIITIILNVVRYSLSGRIRIANTTI